MEMLRKVPGVGPAKLGTSAAWRSVLPEIARRMPRVRESMISLNATPHARPSPVPMFAMLC
jgi:hypothetical protein